MQSKDIHNMIIVGGATMIGGIINYLVHPLAVRMLSTADFGEFAAVLGLVNMIGFIMNAGTIITLKLIAQHHSSSEFMYYLKRQLQQPLIMIGLGLCLMVGLCSGWISHILNLSSGWGIVLMAVGFVPMIYSIILGAILQSGGWFKTSSLINVVGAALRLICVVISLYWIGNGTSTIGAVTIAGLIGFGLTEYLVRRHLGSHDNSQIQQYDGTLMQEIKHSASSYISLIIVTVLLGVLTNSDILLAQYHFGSETSGLYASVAVIAKFVVFIGLAAETVLLPKLFASETITRRQVLMMLGLLWCFGLVSLGGARLLGDIILDTLKPGLGIHVPLLLSSIIINWAVLSLGISTKTIINNGVRTPLWIIGGGMMVRYIRGSHTHNLEHYLTISTIILVSLSLIIQGRWIALPGKRNN